MHPIAPFDLKEFFYSPEAGQAVCNLSRSFAEPMSVGELLALEEGAPERLAGLALGYPGIDGSAGLREEIARAYPGMGADDVIVLGGLDEAIAMLALAALEPGDRIIVHVPCYQSYMTVPAWRGAEVVPWRAREEAGWAPDLDELRQLLQQPARWVIVNFPHNPTGFTPDEAYVRELVDIAARNGTTLLSDEIYAGIALSADPLPAMCALYDGAISMNSVSKRLGIPGLRIGWLVGRNAAVMRPLHELRMHFNSYSASPSEALAAIALRHADEIVNRNLGILRQNAEIADEFFARHANRFAWRRPAAGVNAFPEWLGEGGTARLSERLMAEERLVLAPSARFDAGDRHVRLGLGCRDFAFGMDKLAGFLDRQG